MVENEENGKWEHEELYMCNNCPGHLSNTHPLRVYSLDNDPSGEVFLTASNGLYSNDGKVYRIVGGPNSVDGCSVMKLNTNDEETTQHTTSTETLSTTTTEVTTSSTTEDTTEPLSNLITSPASEGAKMSNEIATNVSSQNLTEPVSAKTEDEKNGTIAKELLKPSLSSNFFAIPSELGSTSSTDGSVDTTKVPMNSISVDKTQTASEENIEAEIKVITPLQTGLDRSLSKEMTNSEVRNHKNGGESIHGTARTFLHMLVTLIEIATFFYIL